MKKNYIAPRTEVIASRLAPFMEEVFSFDYNDAKKGTFDDEAEDDGTSYRKPFNIWEDE